MAFPPEGRKIIHDYSDKLSNAANSILCYALREALAEKLLSLIERSYTAPRDFFDIWYLSKKVPDLDWAEIVAAFPKKMEFKGLLFKGIKQILNEDNHKILKKSWVQSLKHKVSGKDFQEFDVVEKELSELFKKIFS